MNMVCASVSFPVYCVCDVYACVLCIMGVCGSCVYEHGLFLSVLSGCTVCVTCVHVPCVLWVCVCLAHNGWVCFLCFLNMLCA